jgi:hypothetical protein
MNVWTIGGAKQSIDINIIDTIIFKNKQMQMFYKDLSSDAIEVDNIDSITYSVDATTRFEHIQYLLNQSKNSNIKSYYVSLQGNDYSGDGSLSKPWKSVKFAINTVPDDSCVIRVMPGEYESVGYLTRKFSKKILIIAETAYIKMKGGTDAHRIFFFDKAENYIVAGFEITGNPNVNNWEEKYSHLIQISESNHITFENCIIHDCYNNDNIKINLYSTDIVFRGNAIYNQCQNENSGDQHYDVVGGNDLVIEDNIFFNDFKASGRPEINNGSASFIMIKCFNVPNPPSKNIYIARNVFLNWWGKADQSMLLLGENGFPLHNVEGALIENNLFIGNTENRMSGVISLKGAKDVTIRANTITGFVKHGWGWNPGEGNFGYGIRVQCEGQNPPHENINVYNNIWSDPTGRMLFFSAHSKANMASGELMNNLFYNNGNTIEEKPNNCFTPAMDTQKIVADPLLETDYSKVVTPVWNATLKQFGGGAKSVEEARVMLIETFGKFKSSSSPAINAASPEQMPANDILFRHRTDGKPDIGAFEE